MTQTEDSKKEECNLEHLNAQNCIFIQNIIAWQVILYLRGTVVANQQRFDQKNCSHKRIRLARSPGGIHTLAISK